jgi:hypothetical protein
MIWIERYRWAAFIRVYEFGNSSCSSGSSSSSSSISSGVCQNRNLLISGICSSWSSDSGTSVIISLSVRDTYVYLTNYKKCRTYNSLQFLFFTFFCQINSFVVTAYRNRAFIVCPSTGISDSNVYTNETGKRQMILMMMMMIPRNKRKILKRNSRIHKLWWIQLIYTDRSRSFGSVYVTKRSKRVKQ